jgi:DHA1 family bicyclomycin/chloramphenicol resistance-like MFS transporter
MTTRPAAKGAALTLLLGSLAGLAPFALDSYLPAFPEIAASLSTTASAVQQSLTSYLAPYAVMMLVHGPLSDRYGRRASMIAALLIFCTGSIGCALSQTIEAFHGWRMVQGISVGATTVVGRALIRDLFDGAAAQRQFARVNLMFTLAPIVAPIIGGYLLGSAGWRSIFGFLLIYPLALALASWRWLPETLPETNRTALAWTRIPGNVATLARRPQLGTLVVMAAASFCGFFLYILAAPVFARDFLALHAQQFGWLFLATASGTLLGSWWADRRAEANAPSDNVRLGLVLMGAAACANVAYHAVFAPAFPWSLLPLTLYCCGNALMVPSATLLILDTSKLPRGAASSLQSFAQIACSALTSALIVPFAVRSAAWLATAMLGWFVLSALCWIAYRKMPSTSLRSGHRHAAPPT